MRGYLVSIKCRLQATRCIIKCEHIFSTILRAPPIDVCTLDFQLEMQKVVSVKRRQSIKRDIFIANYN